MDKHNNYHMNEIRMIVEYIGDVDAGIPFDLHSLTCPNSWDGLSASHTESVESAKNRFAAVDMV